MTNKIFFGSLIGLKYAIEQATGLASVDKIVEIWYASLPYGIDV
jgi:hypothetical protein